MDTTLITEPELPDYADVQVMPWGWNKTLRKRLLRLGLMEGRLPSLTTLIGYRICSSRVQVAELSKVFRSFPIGKSRYVCGRHQVLSKADDDSLRAVENEYKETGFVLKSVLSGSGRGLRWCRHGMSPSDVNWCRREWQMNGSVLVEPIYNKVEDFAMEFYSDGQGKVAFMGYSLFLTDEKGVYRSNLLMSDEEVECRLRQYIPLQVLVEVREQMEWGLAEVFGTAYTGPLGVDMMVCGGQPKYPQYVIHPHVEVNLRRTMGMLAHEWTTRFLPVGVCGEFRMDSFPTTEDLCRQHRQDMEAHPLVVQDGKLLSGYLPLVPITPKSRYRAYVLV